jgi:hypothetical protein
VNQVCKNPRVNFIFQGLQDSKEPSKLLNLESQIKKYERTSCVAQLVKSNSKIGFYYKTLNILDIIT